MIITNFGEIMGKNNIYLSFFVLLSFATNAFSGEDSLMPCYSSIMGADGTSEYYGALNEKLFVNDGNISNSSKVIKILKLPARNSEISISLYQDTNNRYVLEYVKADGNIWGAILNSEVSDKIKKEIKYVNYSDIQTDVIKTYVDYDIYFYLYNICSLMTNEARLPLDNIVNMGFDGVIYLFSTSPGICGFANPTLKDGKVKTLVGITEELIGLSTSNNHSKNIEKSFLATIESLYEKLCTEKPNSAFCDKVKKTKKESGTD